MAANHWRETMKRAAIYTRVSTDGQTIENQLIALQDVAAMRGWEVVKLVTDEGISGSKGRTQRPGFDELHNGATRGEYDVVMTWAVDRLGRSLKDLVFFMEHLGSCNVELFVHQQAIDTTTPGGKLMFQMVGAFAEFERAMIVSRVNAGLDRARRAGKRIGRPPVDLELRHRAAKLAAGGMSCNRIAKELSIGRATAQRIVRGACHE